MYEISQIINLLDNIKIQAGLANIKFVPSSSMGESSDSVLYLAYLYVDGYESLQIRYENGDWELNNYKVKFDYLKDQLERFDIELQIKEELLNG